MKNNEKIDSHFKELKHSYINIKHLSKFIAKDKDSAMLDALKIINTKIKKIKNSCSKRELDEYIDLNKLYFEYGKKKDD